MLANLSVCHAYDSKPLLREIVHLFLVVSGNLLTQAFEHLRTALTVEIHTAIELNDHTYAFQHVYKV